VTPGVTSARTMAPTNPVEDWRPTMATTRPGANRTASLGASIHPITAGPAAGRSRSLPPRNDDGGRFGGDIGQSAAIDRPLVLSVDDAAYLLHISRGLAYELVARGELPAIRLGRRIVIPRVALEELLGAAIR